MDYLAFGFSDGVGSRSSLSLQNRDQPIERRTSRLWINKLTGRVDDEPASLPARPNRLTPTRSFPQVAVGLEDGRRTTQSPPRRLSTVVSDPSAQSGQSLDADLRNRLAACEEALDAVQTRLASIEAQVRLAGVDDELEDVSDANWASATRAVTDLDRQVAAHEERVIECDPNERVAPRRERVYVALERAAVCVVSESAPAPRRRAIVAIASWRRCTLVDLDVHEVRRPNFEDGNHHDGVE